MALENASVSTTCHWVIGRMSTTCHWDKGRMSTICHSKSESVHNLSLKQRDCPEVSKFQWRVLDSLAVSVTSSGQSHFFSDELWTSSTYLSDKLWTSSQKLNDELWTQSRFFSAINCEEFEIKAKIRVENELFHFFHRAHHISEPLVYDICRNSFSCDSPFNNTYDQYAASNF